MEASERIEFLEREIRKAKNAYYNLDPIISDQVYDAYIDELRSLKPESEEVQSFGADPLIDSPWEKVQHEIPMGSLSKVNEEPEFMEWANSVEPAIFLITYKLDGSSLALTYE
ncbi:MAG TPA: DNA ligase (NAD(+)) LigA, partial [Caldithrix sp.]|nr:DNA ligase (NAD(+)) LigA [Caldithrix sp.]